MRVYTVHLHRPLLEPERDVVLIKEGFSWPACLFSVLWALWHRLWLVALGLIAVQAVISGIAAAVGLDPAGDLVLSLGLAVIVGFVAGDLRRWTLSRAGFVEAGVVAGENAASAERRFYDHRPAVAAELLR